MLTSTFLLLAFFFFFLSPSVDAAGCNGVPTPGSPNNFPILDGSTVLKLVNTSQNGKAYVVTVPNGGAVSNWTLLHVYGTPYQMGFAQGSLLKERTVAVLDGVWEYLVNQAVSALPGYLPKWLDDLIATIGLDAALDLTWEVTRDYTPTHFIEEIRGLCDASGADFDTVVRIHMLAGLTQGKCSMFGAWGDALGAGSSLVQLRALDWDMKGPFRDFSQVTVYHPAPGYGHAFANVGFTGFIGGLTGVSSTQLGISEIGAAYSDASFGSESRIGLPFIFLLRDILQFDYTLDDAISRMAVARRTCDLLLGVGDGKLSLFRGFQYSYSLLNVYDDLNLRPDNQTWHPRIPNIVYWGMDWICPGYNKILSGLLLKYHGQITPELAIQYISPVEKSGDNHIAFYDLTNLKLWVSFAAPHDAAGPIAAYDRQYTRWDLKTLFAEPAPEL